MRHFPPLPISKRDLFSPFAATFSPGFFRYLGTVSSYLRFFWVFSGWLFLPLLLPGQQPGNQLNVQFQRQNNFTYRTDAAWRFGWEGKRYQLQWEGNQQNLFNSSRSDNRFVQLQFHHDLWQFYRLTDAWKVSSWVEVDQFFSSGNQRYSAYLGGEYRPNDQLRIQPLVGYSWDYRSRRLDEGLSPALILAWQQSWEDGLQTDTRVLARYKDLSPRRQINLNVQSTWAKQFDEGAQIAFTGLGGSNEMNDYRAASVERIRSDTAAAILAWSYPLLPGVVWESDNRMIQSRRTLDYQRVGEGQAEFQDLRFGQLDLSSSQRVSFETERLRGTVLYQYQYLTRRYEVENSLGLPAREFERVQQREAQKDYFRNQTNIEFLLQATPWRRHQFDLIGTNRYLKYDTPLEDNFDDHDELNYGLSLAWQATWTRQFRTTARLLGSTRRYAFLFRERSQDNYTQHNLRWEFSYLWNPTARLRIEGEQSVYVTYNIKDFEDRNLTDRSTRNLETRVLWSYRQSQAHQFDGELYRRQVHVSYLNWAAFSETTLDTTTQWIARADWHWRLQRAGSRQTQVQWQIDGGFKHVAQLRYLNTSMVNLQNLLTPINLRQRNHQIGPVTGGSWKRRNGMSISASVWWQWQVQTNRITLVERLTTLNTSFREEELRIPLVNFRPFIQFQANVPLGLAP